MSDKLMKALDQVRTMPEITIGKVVDSMGEDAIIVVCLISILPFLQPIPIPGLSTILGAVAALQGVGFILWSKPLLTKKLRGLHISHERFELIYKAATKVSHFTSKISQMKHPMVNTRFAHVISGFCIVLSALFLSLPLPIPFSNAIPAYSIFFICIALLEQDLALFLIGVGITATAMWMAVFSYHLILEQVGNIFFRWM